MNPVEPGSPARWPQRLRQLAWQSRHGADSVCDTARGEIWLILRTAISGYARLHTQKLGSVPESEVLDLASQKALDLLTRLDSSQWNPTEEEPGQLRAYLSTVARNGIVDLLRTQARTTTSADPEELAMLEPDSTRHEPGTRPPSDDVEAVQFVECLRSCVEALSPRSRKLWFFRVLYEMPSRWIARHPDIQMSVGHVDVTLQRCREAVGECMSRKEMKLRALPPGTFAALWESCVSERAALSEEEGLG